MSLTSALISCISACNSSNCLFCLALKSSNRLSSLLHKTIKTVDHAGSRGQASHSRQGHRHWGNRRHWAKKKFYPNRMSSVVRTVARIADPCRCYGLISPNPWGI